MKQIDKPAGFYVPIHKSLIDPLLIGGIDRNLCLGLWSIGMAIGVMMQMYWFLGVVAIVHIVVRNLTKKDHMFFQALIDHIHNKSYYDV